MSLEPERGFAKLSSFLLLSGSMTAPGQEEVQPLGTAAYRALPDPRGCFSFPECGGYFLYNIDRPFRDLCTDELPFYAYVSGSSFEAKMGP